MRTANAPLDSSLKLRAETENLLRDPTPYRQLVGKLSILVNTRPGLAFTVQYLCQFMQSPSSTHWNAALHTLQYLQGTSTMGLLLSSSTDFSRASIL